MILVTGATGKTHSVREFVELALTGRMVAKTGQVLVEIDPRYFRPTEVDLLLGDPTKARDHMSWRYETSRTEFEMVAADLEAVRREQRGNAE